MTTPSERAAAYAAEPEPRVVVRDKRRIDPDSGQVREPAPSAAPAPADPVEGADPTAGDARLGELLADLQRVKAEYDNYRRRVERDRLAVVEQATGNVLSALLPVLDDLERARQHGDLTGAFGAVADALSATVTKLGLERYGEAGEAFDPTLHEALVHTYAAGVEGPTAVEVYRPGYRHAGRVLRVAQVVVAEPEAAAAPAAPPAGDEHTTG